MDPDSKICPPFGIHQPDGSLEMRGGCEGQGWNDAYDVAEQIDDLFLAHNIHSASVSVARAPKRVLVMLCQNNIVNAPEEHEQARALVRSVYPKFPDRNFVTYTQAPVEQGALYETTVRPTSPALLAAYTQDYNDTPEPTDRGVLSDVATAFPDLKAKDILLVAEQSNFSYALAATVLKKYNGDVVNAIMDLTM